MNNLIDIELTQAEYDEVLAAFAIIRQKMPFLSLISQADADAYQPMEDARKPFVAKAIDYAGSDARLRPEKDVYEAAKRDNNLHTQLTSILHEASQLHELITNTRRVAGSEAFLYGRYVYNLAQLKLKMKEPGMQAIVEDLGKLFKGQGPQQKKA